MGQGRYRSIPTPPFYFNSLVVSTILCSPFFCRIFLGGNSGPRAFAVRTMGEDI